MDKRKNIKIIFLSDTHLGYDYPLRKTNKPHRGEDFFVNFIEVLNSAKLLKADLIIHGGDLFDSGHVNQKVIDRAYHEIFKIADSGIPFLIIPGNHDKKGLPNSLLLEHPNLFFVNESQSLNLKLNGKSFIIDAIPFKRKIGENINIELNGLIRNKEDAYRILLLHQSIEGSKVGPKDFTFKKGRDVLAVDQIPNIYDLVLSGHIHRHQIISSGENDKNIPVIYSGSTERTSFAEIKEDKGYVLIEFSRKDKFIQPEITFRKLLCRAMYDIELKGRRLTEENIKEQLTKHSNHIDDNSIVRINSGFEEVKKKLSTKLIESCFEKNTIISIKGIASIYNRIPKYRKH